MENKNNDTIPCEMYKSYNKRFLLSFMGFFILASILTGLNFLDEAKHEKVLQNFKEGKEVICGKGNYKLVVSKDKGYKLIKDDYYLSNGEQVFHIRSCKNK